MLELTPQQRRTLRARAHHLHPVVSVGQQGLTPQVLHEIDRALVAHELVKVRVFSDDRDEREAMLARIAEALQGAPVQHLGKLLILWRPRPEVEERKAPAAAKRPAKKPPSRRGVAKPAPRERGEETKRPEPAGRRLRGGEKRVEQRAAPAPRRRRGTAKAPAATRTRNDDAGASPRTKQRDATVAAPRSRGAKSASKPFARAESARERAPAGGALAEPRRRRPPATAGGPKTGPQPRRRRRAP